MHCSKDENKEKFEKSTLSSSDSSDTSSDYSSNTMNRKDIICEDVDCTTEASPTLLPPCRISNKSFNVNLTQDSCLTMDAFF